MNIKQLLTAARHDFKLTLKGIVDETLMLDMISLLERGVAVTLILGPENEEKLRDDLFLFNKCLIFLKKGGEIFVHRHSFSLTLAITDYRHALRIADGYEENFDDDEQSSNVHLCIQDFKKLQANANPYLKNKDDISIKFGVNDDIILKGDEVVLTWEVEHADTIVIEGLGEVEPMGSRKIRPGVDTVFKIGAYNATQTGLKTFGIKVYDNIGIDYDLSFSNSRTNKYLSLVNEDNYPHVFGVAHGNSVKINWHVKDSNEVKIMPFEINTARGEHEFLPKENMIIEIQAKVHHRIFTRKIQLLVFPIQLFTDKLVKLTPAFQEELKIVPDLNEIVDQIRGQQQAYNQSFKEIRDGELKKYSFLMKEIHKITFEKSDNILNLEHVNLNIFNRLKGYYARKPGMAEVVKSIKSYYGRA